MTDSDIRGLTNVVNDIKQDVGVINVKLDERCDRHADAIAAVKKRVHQLEINQAKIIGASVVLGTLLNVILKGLGL